MKTTTHILILLLAVAVSLTSHAKINTTGVSMESLPTSATVGLQQIFISCYPSYQINQNTRSVGGVTLSATVTLLSDGLAQGKVEYLSIFKNGTEKLSDNLTNFIKLRMPVVSYKVDQISSYTTLKFDYSHVDSIEDLNVRSIDMMIEGDIEKERSPISLLSRVIIKKGLKYDASVAYCSFSSSPLNSDLQPYQNSESDFRY